VFARVDEFTFRRHPYLKLNKAAGFSDKRTQFP
jgi:hypothetical protein